MSQDEISKRIVKVLKNSDFPLTTKDIAIKINSSWNTAQIKLLKLQNKNVVLGKKIGGRNLWQLKS